MDDELLRDTADAYANGLLPEAVGELKVLTLVIVPNDDERKK